MDGELQLDSALIPEVARSKVRRPSEVAGRANVLIFPDLQSGNIACNLLRRLGGALTIGPILMGLEKPFLALERGCSVAGIVRMTAVAVVEGQWASQRT